MNRLLIPFGDTKHFSPLITDYLAGSDKLRPFYVHQPTPEAFKTAILERRNIRYNRSLLHDILLRQYENVPAFEGAVKKSISSLLDENVFTVTTGHQLNIFTGPLYFIYKIATTIRLASIISQSTGNIIVPVYWMASEDHDFEEIKSAWVYGKKLEWNVDGKGPVGRINPATLKDTLDELKNIAGLKAADILFFEEAYLNSETLAIATRKIVHHLFGEYGLVIIDGDSPELKQLFLPEMTTELIDNSAFKIVNASSEQLAKNYKAQVQPREINLFYMLPAKRERIVLNKDGNYSVNNTDLTFTREKLLEELSAFPERFSPNVVMRTLYQEKILPNLSYTGGPGEINYWLQYKELFNYFKIPFPILILRSCILYIEKNVFAKMSKMGFELKDVFDQKEKILSLLLNKNEKQSIEFSNYTLILEQMFENLSNEIASTDKSLISSVEAEKKKAINGLITVEEKFRRSLKKKNEDLVLQFNAVYEKLFPSGELQERHDNFIPFYLNDGRNWIEKIISISDPFAGKFIVIIESDQQQ
jgi:bacillithiol synthase